MRFAINRKLVYLKLAYIFLYSGFIAPAPYVTLIYVEIASYNQLALMFTLVTIGSITGPLLMGYVADKTGAHRFIMGACLLLAYSCGFLLLTLRPTETSDVSDGESLLNSSAHLSWDGVNFRLAPSDPFNASWTNLSVRLDVEHCRRRCAELPETWDVVAVGRSASDDENWDVRSDGHADLLSSCLAFNCSARMRKAAWRSVVVRRSVRSYAFPLLVLLRTLMCALFDATFILLDAVCLGMADRNGGDFGKQKMWGVGTYAVVPVVTGFLVDAVNRSLGFTDYVAAFAFGAALTLIALPQFFKLEVQVATNKESMWSTAKAIVGMFDVNVFLVFQCVIGMCWQFHMNYMAIFMDKELNSSEFLIGIIWSLNGLMGTISMAVGTFVVAKLGQANTLVVGLLFYSARFIGLSFLKTSWVVLIIDSFDWCIGFLTLLAGNYFCAEASPSDKLASFTAVLNVAVFGVGRGFGTVVGSVLVSRFGLRQIYRAFGITAGTAAILYFCSYHWWLKRIEEMRLAAKEGLNPVGGIENPALEIEDHGPSNHIPNQMKLATTEL